MEIIKNNYKRTDSENNSNPVEKYSITCQNCNSKLVATKEDMHIGWMGAYHITCPCCGEEEMIDVIPGIDVTAKNIQFPEHFYHTNSNSAKTVEILPDRINQEIKLGIKFFRDNKDEWAWYASFGDMFMAMYRLNGENEYYIAVTKDYYEGYVQFEEEDYS